MFQLVSKSGACQGLAWQITDEPLILGRDASCAIQLNDPVVSRRHCRVYTQNDIPRLHDMNSRNATLVNGKPVKDAKLTVGDEVAVGTSVFLIARVLSAASGCDASSKAGGDTSSLKIDIPIYSHEDGDSLIKKGAPRTTRELAQLFTLGRELSQTASLGGFATTVFHHLSEEFPGAAFWLILNNHRNGEPLILPASRAGALRQDVALFEQVQKAAGRKRSFLLPQHCDFEGTTCIRITIASPIIMGQETLGALVAQAHSPECVFEESDLEYLIAHAYAVAPYISAVERVEQLETENRRLVAGIAHEGPIIGVNAGLEQLRAQARDAARSHLSVLILGETGAGKELVARMIHDLSDLADKPMVTVNCAAIPDELFESEVFGHERGAFTGAHAAKKGLMEESNGGTLFLDEIGDLSLPNQARILRAIETGAYRRLGGGAVLQAKVRVLAATNKDLEMEIEQNRFRRDLYHRLNAFILQIPPLRDRREDIPLLAEHFRSLAMKREGRGPQGFTSEALRALERHAWPGNVRELRNIIDRAMVVAKGDHITEHDLGLTTAARLKAPAFLSLEAMERQHIIEALRRANGNVKDAADMLGIGRSTLYRKMAEYQLS